MTTAQLHCKSCSSSNLIEFNAEICLHFRGLSGLSKDPTFVFPTVAVCLDCGTLQGKLCAEELQRIRQSPQRGASTP